MLCSRNPMVAMTLLPDPEQQDQRNRGQLRSEYTPPTSVEVNANYPDLYSAQIGRSGEDSPEDLRVCYSSAMEEIQRSPIKPALKRSVSTEDNNGNFAEEGAEKKRQRVENIVTSICQPKSPKPQDLNTNSDAQKNKRKQFTPQQHGSVTNGDVDVVSSDEAVVRSHHKTSDDSVQAPDSSQSEERKENALLKSQIKIMSEQLQKNQQITHELTEKMKMERYELMTARLALHQPQFDMESCVRAIRAEINQAVKVAFREAYEKQCQQTSTPTQSKDKATSTTRDQLTREREATPSHHSVMSSSGSTLTLTEQMKRSTSVLSSVASPHMSAAPPAHHSLPNPLLPLPLYYGQSLATPSPFSTAAPLTSQLSSNMMSAQLFQAAMENELMESQMYRDRDNQLNKKKRTKVTDTRLSPRNAKPGENVSPNCKQETSDPSKIFDVYGSSSTLFPALNASSMAAMQNAILSGFCPQPPMEALRGVVASGARSPTIASDNSDQCDPSSPDMNMSLHPALPGQNVTLTPLHLRKAKLMFFYVRYPSSVLLKNYFCDVHFNKNNTAQLVKWFSNFREFYYIQMEKYARQSIAEGLTADQVEVTTDSELYKILNLHYNRNNQIEVPRSFLETIQTTLREFIKAVVLGKDREQSWKKPIYKVIARLDDVVPEYFKSQDWMEQLSD